MIELNVQGMTCGGCASTVTRAVKALDPGADVKVDLTSDKVTIEGRRDVQAYARAVTNAGYPASADGIPTVTPKRGGCCG